MKFTLNHFAETLSDWMGWGRVVFSYRRGRLLLRAEQLAIIKALTGEGRGLSGFLSGSIKLKLPLELLFQLF